VILSVAGVAKWFGAEPILRDVNFRLEAREKVALVGRNGAGKTTLLRMLTGQYEPDAGSIQFSRGVRYGYLRQESAVEPGLTVLEAAQTAVQDRLALQARLSQLEALMESGAASAEDLEEYALVHEHFLEAEGYSVESDVRVVLQRMGFTPDEFEKPTEKLSGGERTRLAFSRLLLEEPDLLILDEPTNHLDLQATEWLENWIRGYHGAVLLVSHDRRFLENTAQRVLELRDLTVRSYPGPFDKYLRLRAEEDANQAETARRQKDQMAKLDEYVRRFMNSQRTAQARGRLKMLERLQDSAVEAPRQDRQMQGGFGAAKRSGDIVLETQKLRVGFQSEQEGEVTLISSLDWTVRLGERWGVVGENGAGKSSLLRTILGRAPALGGSARIGASVEVGYFTQDAEDLPMEDSPLDYFAFDVGLKPGEARNLLGRFLIEGDDVFRPIRTLSGGEKNKLALARLTHESPNLLVLDEPTNHLDMASREALADVLKAYKGTLVLISHDRYLLEIVTDRILDLRRTGPRTYPSGFAEYQASLSKPMVEAPMTVSQAPVAASNGLSPREVSKEIERLLKVVGELEQKIAQEESAKTEVEAKLSSIQPGDDVVALSAEHSRRERVIDDLLLEWEQKNEKLETYRRQQTGGTVLQ
jgi:ATP-binding cassette subfamily F protein 3